MSYEVEPNDARTEKIRRNASARQLVDSGVL